MRRILNRLTRHTPKHHTFSTSFIRNKNRLRGYFTILALLCLPLVKAQFFSLPADYSHSLSTEKKLATPDSSTHTFFKPYIPGFSPKYKAMVDTNLYFRGRKHQALRDALFNDHLVHLRSHNSEKNTFDVFLDPLINFEWGKDLADATGEQLYTNTRGLIAGGHLGKQVYFETLLSENQSFFPAYLDSFALEQKVIPGQGRWKVFKTSGYDYAFSSGFVSVQAGQHLNIQFGHGKHKIGQGYRSLFLNDNAFNYPFLRFTQQWFKGRLQYSNLYTVFMNLVPALENPPPGTEALLQKKAASFQYLSFNAGNRVSLGFFQSLMWEPADGNNKQHLDFRYFNPVIYTNLAAFGLNDLKHNLMAGTEVNIKLTRHLAFYAQLAFDDLTSAAAQEGMGYQAGLKYFDAFGIRGLFLQSEYTRSGQAQYNNSAVGAMPYYTHYNQNLATAFANGEELVLIANYRYRRFFLNTKYNYQHHTGTATTPAYNTQLMEAKTGYVLNPAYHLNIYFGLNYRLQKFDNFSRTNPETRYVSLGIKTGLYNLYYDF